MNLKGFTLTEQHQFYHSNATRGYEFRQAQLTKLKNMIIQNEDRIREVVKLDLKKSTFEAQISEIMPVYMEINYLQKNLRKLMKTEKLGSPFFRIYAKSTLIKEPLGSVLIIAPWNYPINLSLTPLAIAIATGNCAVLKPSEVTSHTSQLINELISKTFEPQYIKVVEGDGEVTQNLIKQGFNHCFFTGSTAVGRSIMKTASETLTPVTLELGGKSPCIVMQDADIEKAANRIVFGKFVNSGQTCIAPDYIVVHESVKAKLITAIQASIERSYGDNPMTNENYTGIVSKKHFDRLNELIKGQNVIYGGQSNEEDLKINPTLLDEPTWDSKVMQEEIFGPILPIISFESLKDFVTILKTSAKPLALYLFTESKSVKNYILENTSSGGVTINDTVIHAALPFIPFGGVGDSGMGAYHGKYSFDVFTHRKGVAEATTQYDISLRYAPYSDKVVEIVKKLFK